MENVLYLLVGSLLTLLGFGMKWYLNAHDRYGKYRSTTIEKRLDAHQKAFNLTYEIQKGAHPDKFESIFNHCQQWWSENNFYLEPHSRKLFHDCYWELLIFHNKTTDPNMVERRLHFIKEALPETRKYLTEEIGLTWLRDPSPEELKNNHSG